jgi:16S rRNA (adenine1518-N6/adenine1519-N6)-dimethyltransferase
MEQPKQILNQYGVQPKKSLGQNFLADQNILRRICDCAKLTENDHVLEIGPGIGSLTSVLAPLVRSVTAVELDRRLIPILENEFSLDPNVRIIHGDILDMAPNDLMAGEPYKAVANMPYYITGEIFRHLLSPSQKPTTMALTVQKEVAQRLTAAPGKMSIFAVSVQLHGHVSFEFIIRAGSFWPAPDVDSAVVLFEAFDPPMISDSEVPGLMKLVRAGFSSRRKQIHKNLRSVIPSDELLEDAFHQTGIVRTQRAQSLSVDQWIALYRAVSGSDAGQ